jgi:hypothetical protein
VLSFELLMRQLCQQLSSKAVPQLQGTDVHLAASPPLAAPRLTNELGRGVGRESLLDKARHIRADQEGHGTRLTGNTLAAVRVSPTATHDDSSGKSTADPP